jgi:hypothetical protein
VKVSRKGNDPSCAFCTSCKAEIEVSVMVERWNGIYRIESSFTKREGPDGQVHEGWCAIFEHECCSCRDRGKGKRRYVRRGPGGVTVKREEEEFA